MKYDQNLKSNLDLSSFGMFKHMRNCTLDKIQIHTMERITHTIHTKEIKTSMLPVLTKMHNIHK